MQSGSFDASSTMAAVRVGYVLYRALVQLVIGHGTLNEHNTLWLASNVTDQAKANDKDKANGYDSEAKYTYMYIGLAGIYLAELIC